MTGEAHDCVLRFENVSVRFEDVTALDRVSFAMRAGETRVILGAAGSGKTILLKAALGLVRAGEGRVLVFGEDITRRRERELYELRSRIGMLFQEGGLFDSLTVEENVAYPLVNQKTERKLSPAQVREKVEESLRFVELGHTLEKFPSQLSGGIRRRVGIARAAVTEPPLVLYDSPTAGLDPITANNIIALIVKERDVKNTTTALVTHRYQDGALLADFRYNSDSGQLEPLARNGRAAGRETTFMVMREGRLVFEGAQDELESSRDPYIAKFARQSSE
ncbi:MAG: ATP-binding cassette domain-containing protein [Acidobacteria bacterium]|nr:ATP-binding cassette domain-containing protein [Acidobacteriota bacterium]